MAGMGVMHDTEARSVGVDAIAALRAVTLLRDQVLVRGISAAGDGGGGLYSWSAASTAADDGFLIVRPTAVAAGSPGRWARIPLGPPGAELAADATNNNATANTLQDITGLSFPVVAGQPYSFRFYIAYTAAALTTGARFTINGPAFSMLAYSSRYPLTTTTETVNHGMSGYNTPAGANASSLLTGNLAVVEGVVVPTAAGVVVARFASEVASSAITVKAGSSVTYW